MDVAHRRQALDRDERPQSSLLDGVSCFISEASRQEAILPLRDLHPLSNRGRIAMARSKSPMTAAKRMMLVIPCGLALCFAVSDSASASMLVGWWGGKWSCNIDGRSARMRWAPVEAGINMCDENGRNCVRNDRLRWLGGFSDNGSREVRLTDAREGSRGGLNFRHADGNHWYLAKPAGNKATGWTTWNGRRYPLSCWR
jgi:hypothetical protein